MDRSPINPWMDNEGRYRHATPDADDKPSSFALYLEGRGACETVILRKVMQEFNLPLNAAKHACEKLSEARILEISYLSQMKSWPDERALARKVAGNLGIAIDEALLWVERLKEREAAM